MGLEHKQTNLDELAADVSAREGIGMKVRGGMLPPRWAVEAFHVYDRVWSLMDVHRTREAARNSAEYLRETITRDPQGYRDVRVRDLNHKEG